ncbi:MAG: hypothetical protein LBI12_05700 [Treponema sp.]|nr:hypothetical protein [Treponema sp.]
MIKLPVIFISIILVWIIISRFFVLMFSGIFIYIILFPLSFMFNEALDFLMLKYILKKDAADESLLSFSGGITAVAAFICVNISNNFLETVILSFGFTSGILLVILFIREIRRRAALEAVPKFIRGKPLVLVSLGLLALVFSVASLFILRMYSFR